MRRIGIVGGGVIGLATAYHLARKGAHPVVIDAGKVGNGCSAGNAGWICPSISTPLPHPDLTARALLGMMKPGSPLYVKPSAVPSLQPWLRRFRAHCTQADYRHGLEALAALNRLTPPLFEALDDDGVDVDHHRQGMLLAFRKRAKLDGLRAELETQASLGVAEFRELGEREVYEREPLLRAGFVGGIFVDSDSHVRPESLTVGLAEALRLRGAEIREDERVVDIAWEGDRAQGLVTERATILVDDVVLAAGAETGPLAASCGLALPLTAGKGYSVTIDAPTHQLSQPLYLGEAKVGLTPFRGALRLAGTMELSGVNRELDRRRVKAIRTVVVRDVNLPEARDGGREWVGMRPMVPDTLPVVGGVPGRSNVYLSTAHQMLGVTLSLSSGSCLADLILDGASPVDLGPFSPARF